MSMCVRTKVISVLLITAAVVVHIKAFVSSCLNSHWLLRCQELVRTMLRLKDVLCRVNRVKSSSLNTSELGSESHVCCKRKCGIVVSVECRVLVTVVWATFRNLRFLVEHPCDLSAPFNNNLSSLFYFYSLFSRSFLAQEPTAGQGHLIVEVSDGHSR